MQKHDCTSDLEELSMACQKGLFNYFYRHYGNYVDGDFSAPAISRISKESSTNAIEVPKTAVGGRTQRAKSTLIAIDD